MVPHPPSSAQPALIRPQIKNLKTWHATCDMLAATGEKTSPMILEAEFEPVDLTTAVFRLTGRMILGTRLREVESKISEIANHGIHRLILDLSGIEYLDSAGLGAILILYGNMKVRGGQFRLVAPGAKVLEVLKMTHTDSILKIDRTLEAALAS
jgi:anti-sigma B factor antagonist